MRKYLLLSFIIIFIIYYICTFLISFNLLAKSVVNNDPVSLARHIDNKELKNNFFEDIYEYSLNLIHLIDKNISIKSESIEFIGELTPTFMHKLFFQLSENVSKDFSSPKIMLYFYFNSNEIKTYLNESLSNLGDYNFEKFHLENQLKNFEDNIKNEVKKESINKLNQGKEENILLNLFQRIKSTNYFFLISPIHFKIDVIHQDIQFVVILKFTGYMWKIQKIKIPFKELINSKNIKLNLKN